MPVILPLISIITISYNEKNNIENTINSVINQTYKNIEFIIIDGKSTDGTVDIINKYKEQISLFISEKDKGIYDAMNKANDLASGDYIIFLNSGDSFSSKTIVQEIIANTESFNYTLITGRTKIYYEKENLNLISPPSNIILDNNTKTYSHQSTFIHKKIYKFYNYNLNYKISADKEYWYKIKNTDNFNIKFHDLNIASFELGGVSNNHKNAINRRIEDIFIEYTYDKVTLNKFIIFFCTTILSYFLTKNEKFYFKKIYPLINKIKNKKVNK
ncbi:MAG: glycosyltransferase [Arcobacter sp.]|nr:MAG: glycosyltransferase [Arcobacter sp.]